MRRALAIAALALAAIAPAAKAAEWHSEQPMLAGIGVPVALGWIGDLQCWSPSRCLLITPGNDAVSAGLLAYDGAGWYQLSTVCGGHDGRIAWAGPNEWWTISDQALGQEISSGLGWRRSLCHFRDGAVVASYAEPIGTATSYGEMSAAACNGPDDCWFAGERLPGTVNNGAFHLHWDGSSLTAVPSLSQPQPQISDPGRAVESLAFHKGHLYESVQVAEGDMAPSENELQPFLVHEIAASASNPFVPQVASVSYGAAAPTELDALCLASDGTSLWAVAGATPGSSAPVNVLRRGPFGFEPLALDASDAVLAPGSEVRALAAEPGSGAVWLAFSRRVESGAPAPVRLVRIGAGGAVEAEHQLPAPSEGIGRKGPGIALACPAQAQCWLATLGGWLFHLGGPSPVENDPLFHRLIDHRPPDNGVPFVPPDSLPIDDSGAELPYEDPLPIDQSRDARRHRPKPLTSGVRQRLLGHSVLELSFSLRARARVRLVAKRRRRVVAKTDSLVLGRGRHRLRLRLDPERWPTSLDLQAREMPGGAR